MNEHEHYTGPGLKEIWEDRGKIGIRMGAAVLGVALAWGAVEVVDRMGLKEKLGLVTTSSEDRVTSTINNEFDLTP